MTPERIEGGHWCNFQESLPLTVREPKSRRRLASKIAVLILGAAASLTGTYYLIINKNTATFDGSEISRAINTTINIQSKGPGSEEASEKDTADSAGPEPRNIFLFNNEFKLGVMRATDQAPTIKKQFRDKVLGIIEELVGALAAGDLGESQIQSLGKSLGAIIEDAPISKYQLTSREFTLRPGTAYFLPKGGHTLAVVGPYGAERPDAIYVRRNGRKVAMSVGSVRIFKQDGETCTLMLHDLAQNYATATFSFSCGDT